MIRKSIKSLAIAAASAAFAFVCLASPASASAATQVRPMFACQSGNQCWDGVFGGNCQTSCGCELADGSVDKNNSDCKPVN